MTEAFEIAVWIVVSVLAAVGWWRYRQTQRFYREMIAKKEEQEALQNHFATQVSEEIHTIAKGESHSSTAIEKTLVDVTADLLAFLRLKSKKVTIVREKFNINRVLDEVAGRLEHRFKPKQVEVIFDIDHTIPRYLIGDAAHLESVLFHLLEYMIDRIEQGETVLDVTMFKKYDDRVELQWHISGDVDPIEPSEIETLFIPYYDEANKTYHRLGLFIARALIELMGGQIRLNQDKKRSMAFVVSLPFELPDITERRRYRLPQKSLTVKKVLICDMHLDAALAVKKMFAYFRHEVTVMEKEEFLRKKIALESFDIVAIHPLLMRYKKIEGALRQAKAKQPSMKIVALDTLLWPQVNQLPEGLIDRTVTKPLTQERVFELVLKLFVATKTGESVTKTDIVKQTTHYGIIGPTEGIDRERFADFAGMRLLVAEDDTINQRLIENLLADSGIEVTFADNGWQAVNQVKESEKPFDVVLMDINMPILDGYTATRMIREESRFKKLPVIAFTALTIEDEREKIFESGMNAWLSKPLDMRRLYSAFKLFYRSSKEKRPQMKRSIRPPLESSDDTVLDIADGLRHSNNNETFYREVLRSFLDAYGENETLFAKLVREHRFEQLKMHLLDMKGLAATIGARRMFAFLSDVHKALLYRRYEEAATQMARYAEEMARLRSAIDNYLHKE